MDTDWLKVTCHYTPTQLEGTSPDGDSVYFRFRRGRATLDLNGATIWAQDYGDRWAGVMDTSHATALVLAVVDLHHNRPGAADRYRDAHAAARADLPVGPARPLDADTQALMDRFMATVPPAVG